MKKIIWKNAFKFYKMGLWFENTFRTNNGCDQFDDLHEDNHRRLWDWIVTSIVIL